VLFHPPIKLTGTRPRGHFHLHRRVDFPAVCIGDPLQVIVAELNN
jgi:hypothetical protein